MSTSKASLPRRWEELAGSPVAWLETATLLRTCADIIGQRFVEDLLRRPPRGTVIKTEGVPAIAFGPVFQMLAGYAIEALLKGVLVARKPEAVAGGRLPKWLAHHDLEALLKEVGLVLDASERDFVRRLAAAVVWSGRYPVPKVAEKMQSAKWSSSADPDEFHDVYDRLAVILASEMRRAGW